MTLSRDATSRQFITWGLLNSTRIGILLVLFMPLVVTPSTLFPFIVGKAIYARCMIEITFGLWLVLLLLAPEYRPRRSWIMIAISVWLLISVISGLVGVSVQRSLWSTYERMQGIVDLAHWTAFVLMAGSLFRTLDNWKWLLGVNLIVSVVVSFLGLVQIFDLFQIDILSNSSSTRLTSTLGNATYAGAYTMVNIFIALALIAFLIQRDQTSKSKEMLRGTASQRVKRRRKRASKQPIQNAWLTWTPSITGLLIGVVGIEFLALWFTGTRGAFIGFGAGAVTFAVVYSLRGKILQIKVASYAILSLAAVISLLFIVVKTTTVLDAVTDRSPTLTRLANIGPNDQNIKGRITSITAGLQAAEEKPLFGWGPENYLIAWGRYFDADSGVEERFDQAHNKLIEELTTKGIIGVISYLSIWMVMIWVFARSVKNEDEYAKLILILIGAALSAYFVQNMSLFDSPVTVLQFAVLVAFFVAEETRQRQPNVEIYHKTGWRRQIREFRGRMIDWKYLRIPTSITVSAFAVLVFALISCSVYLFNVKLFNAAGTMILTTNPSNSWDQRFGYFDKTINEFPALANFPRIILIKLVSDNVQTLTNREFEIAKRFIQEEGKRGLNGEPENWRIHAILAGFYQAAAYLEAPLLDLARDHVEEAVVLAPRTLEVKLIESIQAHLDSSRTQP